MNRDRLLIALTALNAMDGVLTFWTVNVSGIAREANPIMLALMEVHPVAFLLFKLLFIPVLLHWAMKGRFAIWTGAAFAVMYVFVVAANLWILFDAFVLGSF